MVLEEGCASRAGASSRKARGRMCIFGIVCPSVIGVSMGCCGLFSAKRQRASMKQELLRRDFLKAAPAAAGMLARAAQDTPAPSASSRIVLQPFDYQGVRLTRSRWLQQVQQARDYYFGLPDDDILK